MPTHADIAVHAESANLLLSDLGQAPIEWTLVVEGPMSRVLRGGGMITKQTWHDSDHSRELPALMLIRDKFPGLGPALITANEAGSTMVLEDLGDGPSLATALLGDDPLVADTFLNQYVDELARLHNETRGTAGSEPLTGFLYDVYPQAIDTIRSTDFPSLLPVRDGALEEISHLRELAGPTGQSVFSFGDMCPDNNVQTNRGLRFFDLEGAGYVDPALDLAYLTVPFPSCWCSYDLPKKVEARVVDRYCSKTFAPETTKAALHRAEMFYLIFLLAWRLPRALSSESVKGHPDRPSPESRQVVAHRIERVSTNPASQAEFPAFTSWISDISAALKGQWGEVVLPMAPAYRGS